MGVSGGQENTATLFLLLDLATFFDLYHAGRMAEALDTLEKIKVGQTLIDCVHFVNLRYICDKFLLNF